MSVPVRSRLRVQIPSLIIGVVFFVAGEGNANRNKRKVTGFYGDINNLQSKEVPFDAIEKYAKGTSLEVDNTTMLIIELPSSKLEGGLSIIDTPGVGGLDPRHLFLTLYVLPKADVTFLLQTQVSHFRQQN